jgi:hypothetical protein
MDLNRIKDLLGSSVFIYGPVTYEQAFNVSVTSHATAVDGQWYVGSYEELNYLTEKLIHKFEPSLNNFESEQVTDV